MEYLTSVGMWLMLAMGYLQEKYVWNQKKNDSSQDEWARALAVKPWKLHTSLE